MRGAAAISLSKWTRLTPALDTSCVGNEDQGFPATILTLRNRTLPALVLSQIADVGAPLPFRFAAGFFLIAPALVFIFFMRRYLLGMWGQVVK